MSSDNFNSNFLERRRNIRKHPYLIEQSDNTSQEILSKLSDKRFAFDAYKKPSSKLQYPIINIFMKLII